MSMHILPIKAIANISTDKLKEVVSQLQEKSKNTQHLYDTCVKKPTASAVG